MDRLQPPVRVHEDPPVPQTQQLTLSWLREQPVAQHAAVQVLRRVLEQDFEQLEENFADEFVASFADYVQALHVHLLSNSPDRLRCQALHADLDLGDGFDVRHDVAHTLSDQRVHLEELRGDS